MIDAKNWMDSRTWIDLDNPDVMTYVSKISDEVGFDLAEKLLQWHERGVVIFENVVDKSLISALLNDLEYLKLHYRDFDLEAEIKGQCKPISQFAADDVSSPGVKFNHIHTISDAAGKLSLTKEVAVFLQHVFGSAACALQSLTFYRGSQQPAHVDYPYVRCQNKIAHLAASWIPLEDIHANSGPLEYYTGSHKPEVSGFFDFGNGSIVLEPDSKYTPIDFSRYLENVVETKHLRPEIFLPKLGDVLVWHGNLIHGGSKIIDTELTRKSYVTHYTSELAYPAAHKYPDGRGISVHGGHVYEYPWLKSDRKKLPGLAD